MNTLPEKKESDCIKKSVKMSTSMNCFCRSLSWIIFRKIAFTQTRVEHKDSDVKWDERQMEWLNPKFQMKLNSRSADDSLSDVPRVF